MLHLAEILRAHAQQRRAIDFRIPADIVVDAGVKPAPNLVSPGFLGLVLLSMKTVLELPLSFSRGR